MGLKRLIISLYFSNNKVVRLNINPLLAFGLLVLGSTFAVFKLSSKTPHTINISQSVTPNQITKEKATTETNVSQVVKHSQETWSSSNFLIQGLKTFNESSGVTIAFFLSKKLMNSEVMSGKIRLKLLDKENQIITKTDFDNFSFKNGRHSQFTVEQKNFEKALLEIVTSTGTSILKDLKIDFQKK
jgi:hypothetical protein